MGGSYTALASCLGCPGGATRNLPRPRRRGLSCPPTSQPSSPSSPRPMLRLPSRQPGRGGCAGSSPGTRNAASASGSERRDCSAVCVCESAREHPSAASLKPRCGKTAGLVHLVPGAAGAAGAAYGGDQRADLSAHSLPSGVKEEKREKKTPTDLQGHGPPHQPHQQPKLQQPPARWPTPCPVSQLGRRQRLAASPADHQARF